MKLATIIACASLAGCVTCEQHPIACTAGSVIVTGIAVASIEAHTDRDHHHRSQGEGLWLNNPPCYIQPDGSCR